MQESVDRVFAHRRRLLHARGRWPGILGSLALHVALVGSVVLAPALAARQRQPPEFLPVMIVPAQALGVPEPAPAPAPRRQPRPEPQAAPPEPEREPEPESAVLPDPEARKPAPPRQASAAAPPATAAGDGSEARGQRRGSPTGSPTGTATFGGAIAGLDNPDFVYSYYIDQMLAMIGNHWDRPRVDGPIEAVVHFRIASDGRVIDLELAESSGLDTFDLAALRAVRLADPLPPLPRSFQHESLGVNLIVR